MALVSYKCPNCGGALTFHPESGTFQCDYCLSEFTKEEIEEAALKSEGSAGMPEEDAGTEPGGSRMVSYICPSCGAQVVTGETTAAAFCYYCHNPVVLSDQLSGEFQPDFVIPFAFDQKKAEEIFLGWIKKKRFVPKDFFSRDQIEKLSGVYFPYLVYSCRVEGKLQAEGERQRTWRAGNIRYTEHKKYRLERGGELDVKKYDPERLKEK